MTEQSDKEPRLDFSKYMSPEVTALLSRPSLVPAGKEVEAAVLLPIIHNLNELISGKSLRDYVSFLDDYYAKILPMIFLHNGRVDHFITTEGSLLATFEAQNYHPDHAMEAVLAAIKIEGELKKYNQEREEPDKLDFGILVNSGPIYIGDIGTDERRQYTAIGQTVDNAWGLAKENMYIINHSQSPTTVILITESVHQLTHISVGPAYFPRADINDNGHPIAVYPLAPSN